ncbi:MAG: hypothetical protein KF764_31615 [Labilithrix sp.]|nr:hypothetical protein [Labilithrix sp.]
MRRLHGLFVCASVLALCGTASAQDLAPPPPINPGAPGGPGSPTIEQQQQGETTRRLDEAEQKDSGRNFELFWLDGSIGGSYINMSQFSSESLQIEKTSAGGPAFSVGAGVRFVILVLGARLRHNALSTFNMWQINAEAGLKIPVSSFDILFGLHGGYSFVGRLGDAGLATNTETPASTDAVSIRGFNGGVDVAFDYYVSPLFSVGAGLLGDFLFLNRPPVAKPGNFATLTPDQQAAIENDPVYAKSGTSAGLQLAGGLRLGLHFGL